MGEEPDANPEEGLRVSADFSVLHDSNIIGQAGGPDDVEFLFAPTASYTRRSGLIWLDASLGGEFGFFADHDEYDYTDFEGDLVASFPNAEDYRYRLEARAGYKRDSQIDRFAGDRVTVDIAHVGARLRYEFSERWASETGLSWQQSAYQDASVGGLGTKDQSSWELFLDGVYIYSEKLDFLLGYRHRRTTSEVDFEDHLFRLAARGDLTPKISGTLAVGYQTRKSNGQGVRGVDSGDPFFFVDLTWSPTDKTQVVLSALWDYQTTLSGASARVAEARIFASHSLTDEHSVGVGMGYRDYEFSGIGQDRSDDSFFLEASWEWRLSERLTLAARCQYEDNGSTDDLYRFDRTRVGLALTWRF